MAAVFVLLMMISVAKLLLSFVHAREARMLCEAIKDNDLERLESLLEDGAYIDSPEMAPVLLPVAMLCEAGMDTPLYLACQMGNVEAVKLLLEHGADPNYRFALGWSPVGAVYAGPAGRAARMETIPLLLPYGASVEGTGHGALWNHAAFLEMWHASDETAEESIVLIAQMTDDPANVRNRVGMTLLCACSSPEIAAWLVENGADVNATDDYDLTPLMRAAMRGDEAMVAFLLEHGADTEMVNKDGKRAYDLAVDRDYTELAELIGE